MRQTCRNNAASSCDVCLRATFLSSDLTKIEGIIKGVFQYCTLHEHLLSQVAQYKVAYVIE